MGHNAHFRLRSAPMMPEGGEQTGTRKGSGTGWPGLNACPVWRVPGGLANSIPVMLPWSKDVEEYHDATRLAQIVVWQRRETLNFFFLEIEGLLWPFLNYGIPRAPW